MTNVRKRHLYPITNGKKKPRSSFDRYLLAQHNQLVEKFHEEASLSAFQRIYKANKSRSTNESNNECSEVSLNHLDAYDTRIRSSRKRRCETPDYNSEDCSYSVRYADSDVSFIDPFSKLPYARPKRK